MAKAKTKSVQAIPSKDILAGYIFKALMELGGSGSNKEIDNTVEKLLNLPEDVASIPHLGSYTQTELSYRIAWAKTELKKRGIIINSKRSVWSILPQYTQYKTLEEIPIQERLDKEEEEETQAEVNAEHNWIEDVSKKLQAMDPFGFERLTQRLLRECGFSSVTVTKKSGDGGIDGFGELKILGIFSFRIAFQCKRYQGTVGSREIRDFRGSLTTDIEKALFITTGTFTKQAIEEASKEGTLHIDLMDGTEFIKKLAEFNVGVRPKEAYEIDDEFFDTI